MRPALRASILALLPTLLIAQAPVPAPAAAPAGAPAVQAPTARPPQLPAGVPGQLMKTIAEQGKQLADLQELVDTIGPRLTGSERMRKAHAWAQTKLTQMGAANVHEEAWEFGLSWTRGVDHARLLTHNQMPLLIAHNAFTPGIDKPTVGEVMEPADFRMETLQGLKGQLKGKILLRSMGARPAPGTPRPTGMPAMRDQEAIAQFLKDEGVLAVFTMSNKNYGLLTTGGRAVKEASKASVPTATLTQEGFKQLQRLIARKEPVKVELQLGGKLGKTPVKDYNVIGEIRGSEKPEEVVIIGAHMDSWDLSTGTNDNGTGTCASLEALRAILASGAKPKRTIRVVLFSGEEQGLLGSKAYADAHKAELDKVQAVIVDDMGTGRIRGWALQGREDVKAAMAGVISPMNDFDLREVSLARMGSTDHASFLPFGVPAFSAQQEAEDYFTHTHHSHVDAFERVKPEAFLQGTQALAVTAWELANLDQLLPHKVLEASQERR
ncbi:MAG TPA: M20/M25/M40 family metallo-hydrolase [Holophagaceae bacterium]|nr:M20/M25/M40 family metallo-hydrolase [Holophagaceae bacterium]